MEKKDNVFVKIWKSVKRLFISLFGFGKQKNAMDDELLENIEKAKEKALMEDELISPTKQILKKFVRNKISIIGFVIFIVLFLFIIIGSNVIEFNAAYTEGSQQFVEPKLGYTKIPRKLQKVGVKVVEDGDEENYLIGIGTAFSVAIGNDDKVYVWGANVRDIKKVPDQIKEKAKDIVQLSVGMRHAVALTKDGEFLGWGSNGFEQSQIPVFDPNIDESFQHKKTIQAYFDKSVRDEYASYFVTAIEDDPIAKVYAGPETTTILTESGRVYSWGITKLIGISEPNNSHDYLVINITLNDNGLQWKYSGELNAKYRTIMTIDEIKAHYELVEVPDKEIVLNYGLSRLRWRYDDESEWNTLATKEQIFEMLPPGATTRKIVAVYPLAEQVAYEFDDNSFAIVGQETAAKYEAPEYLSQSAAERGFRILEIRGTLKNNFIVTSEGWVHGWGTYNSDNRVNDIPEEVQSKHIVEIKTGSYHVVARDIDGNLYTWGSSNDLNQLNLPKKLDSSQRIFANYFNNISISEDGKLTAWGNNGYVFGTDFVGADNFKRIIKGGSITITLAAIAVVTTLILGLIAGLIAGFYGGWIDNTLMRFGEIVNAFPFLPLAMTLAVLVTEKGFTDIQRMVLIMVILGFLSWPGLARLIRGQILAEREKDFVMAAKALGIKERHIITRHILPNVINVVIVSTTLRYAGALLTESGLSYLGFGVKYPEPSWGNMLTGAQSSTILKNYWWVWIIPAVFIVLTALSINLIGDGLRDAMDPKSSER